MSEKNKQIVRVRTSVYSDKKGIYTRRDIIFQKRKSEGFQPLTDEVEAAGADLAVGKIINFDDNLKDGLYEVIIVNVYKDWETGYIEDYDFELIRYKEN